VVAYSDLFVLVLVIVIVIVIREPVWRALSSLSRGEL